MSRNKQPLETAVTIQSCTLKRANLSVGTAPTQDEGLEISFSITIRRIDAGEEPVGLEATAQVIGNEGKAFSYEFLFRSSFGYPDEMTIAERKSYLAKFGATRTIDAIRPVIEHMAFLAGTGAVSIPPLAMTLHEDDLDHGAIQADQDARR